MDSFSLRPTCGLFLASSRKAQTNRSLRQVRLQSGGQHQRRLPGVRCINLSRYRKLKMIGVVSGGVFLCLLVSSYFYEYGVYVRPISFFFRDSSFTFAIENSEFERTSFWKDRGSLRFRWKPIYRRSNVMGTSFILVPLWIPTVVALVMAAFVHRKAKLKPSGHCGKCGYSLTGNTSGVCPECGVRTCRGTES